MSAQDAVRATKVFARLVAQHPSVEVWSDEGNTEAGYSYFWLVSNQNGTVRELAYVRQREGEFQKRTYDDNGDDSWIAAD